MSNASERRKMVSCKANFLRSSVKRGFKVKQVNRQGAKKKQRKEERRKALREKMKTMMKERTNKEQNTNSEDGVNIR
jgi:hypothetical protein